MNTYLMNTGTHTYCYIVYTTQCPRGKVFQTEYDAKSYAKIQPAATITVQRGNLGEVGGQEMLLSEYTRLGGFQCVGVN